MEPTQHLQLSFTTRPIPKITTRLIGTDNTQILQSDFRVDECPGEWITALKGIAAATSFARFATSVEISGSEHGAGSLLPTAPFSDFDRASSLVSDLDVSIHGSEKATDSPLAHTSFESIETSGSLYSRRSSTQPSVTGSSTAAQTGHARWQPTRDAASETQSIRASRKANGTIGRAHRSSTRDEVLHLPASPCPTVKRRQKLDAHLKAIREGNLPSQSDLNDTVHQLYQHPISSSLPVTSIEQFGHILGRLGNVSSAVGMIYSLLSFEIFRREEERLVREDGQPHLMAAKRMNDKMAERSNRRAISKDWASDGRRAAGMVFGAIGHLSASVQSFALILLAGKYRIVLKGRRSQDAHLTVRYFAVHISPDALLRIAHFPTLRGLFRDEFNSIVEARQQEWLDLPVKGYLIFDYQEFLQSHVNTMGPRDAWSSSSVASSATCATAVGLPRSAGNIESMVDLDVNMLNFDGNFDGNFDMEALQVNGANQWIEQSFPF